MVAKKQQRCSKHLVPESINGKDNINDDSVVDNANGFVAVHVDDDGCRLPNSVWWLPSHFQDDIIRQALS